MALSKIAKTNMNTKVDELIIQENTEEVVMSINKNAMRLIIDRLTDLYPNPEISTVREVVSNAIDATMLVDPGERKSVKIFKPSALQPNFKVQDFGVGMSLDDVRKVYSQYGGSTKGDDFSQIGAYGLGAKAPLAYTTEFFVRTSKDGITTEFTCVRGEEGNFTKILSVENTGEAPGTTVTIPVRTKDAPKFNSAIDNYKKFKNDDVSIEIDNEPVTVNEEFVLIDDRFLLDEESNTFGKIWVTKSFFHKSLFNALTYGSLLKDLTSINYLLSGWVYSNTSNNNNYYYDRYSSMIVEIKPGVLDFSSSRDDVVNNIRKEKLDQRIQAKYMNINKDLLMKFFESCKTFDNLEALIFFSNIRDLILSVNHKDSSFVLDCSKPYYRQNPSAYRTLTGKEDSKEYLYTFDFSVFDNFNGFNPIKLMLNNRKNDVKAVIDMTINDARFYDRIEYKTGEKTNLNKNTALVYSRAELTSEGNVNRPIRVRMNEIVNSVSEGPSQEFIKTALSLIIDNNYRRNWSVNSNNKEFKVIVNSDEKTAELINKNRIPLSNHEFKNSYIILLEKDLSDEIKEIIESLDTFKLSVLDNAKLESAIKLSRNNMPKRVKPKEVDEVRAYRVEDHKTILSKAFTAVSYHYGIRDNSVEYKIKEIINENALIVLVKDDNSNYYSNPNLIADTYRGVLNDNVDLGDNPVYIIKQNNVNAAIINKLAKYDRTYVTEDWSYNCKSSKELIKNKKRSSLVLVSSVEKYDTDELIKAYIRRNIDFYYINASAVNLIVKEISSRKHDDEDNNITLLNTLFKETLEIIQNIRDNNSRKTKDNYLDNLGNAILKDIINKRRNDDLINKLDSIIQFINWTSYDSRNFEDQIIKAFVKLDKTHSEDDEFSQQIAKFTVDNMIQKLNEKKTEDD